jgi:4-hydroxy-tetrahydrodipicolinate synthase
MQRQMEQGELAAARRTFYRLLPWMQQAFAEPNPAVVKGALAAQGMIADELREPMLPCTPATFEQVREVLAALAD